LSYLCRAEASLRIDRGKDACVFPLKLSRVLQNTAFNKFFVVAVIRKTSGFAIRF
jgi:hypothetical protein